MPRVRAGGDWVVWATAEKDRSARQWAWKAGSSRPRTILRRSDLDPGSESVVGDELVFLDHSALPHTGHTVRRVNRPS